MTIEEVIDGKRGVSMGLLFCPLLVGQEERKAIMIGQGDVVVPILYPCIKDKCVAYRDSDNYCEHFKKCVYRGSEG